MSYETLLISRGNGVETITLNRPENLNALNTKVFAELEKAVLHAISSEEIRVIVITGQGTKSFAAGADIKEFMNFTQEEGAKLAANGQRIFQIIEDSPKPVIAAVNGFALGGGCELAMSCHMRLASENAKFGQPEVSLGVTPGYAGTQRLTRLIGRTKATELLITGKMIQAQEALALGLVNHVYPLDQLMEKTYEMAALISAQSPVAIAGVLRSINAYYEKGTDGFETEVNEFGKCFTSEDFKEGTQAFVNKRKPNFSGK